MRRDLDKGREMAHWGEGRGCLWRGGWEREWGLAVCGGGGSYVLWLGRGGGGD